MAVAFKTPDRMRSTKGRVRGETQRQPGTQRRNPPELRAAKGGGGCARAARGRRDTVRTCPLEADRGMCAGKEGVATRAKHWIRRW